MSESPQKLRRIEAEKEAIRKDREEKALAAKSAAAMADKAWKETYEEKVRALAKKHALELDADTRLLVEWIIKGGYAGGMQKMLTKDWVLAEAVRIYGTAEQAQVKQRALEFIADLQGYSANKGDGDKIRDVVMEALDAPLP